MKPPRRFVAVCSCGERMAEDLSFDGTRWRRPNGDAREPTPKYLAPCRACGTFVQFRMVRVVDRPGVACTAVCTDARGPLCECSCGGRNHGRAYIRGGLPALS